LRSRLGEVAGLAQNHRLLDQLESQMHLESVSKIGI
jgi:hypothetical protein